MENLVHQNVSSFDALSPVECYKLNFLSIYYSLIMILSITLNISVILGLNSPKKLENSFDVSVYSLSILNLLGSMSELPVVILTNYNCRWLFGKLGCNISGFTMYFVGCSSLYLMTFISFERYYFFRDPKIPKIISVKETLIIIGVCILVSLFWCVVPLIGWSHYSLEKSLVSCSVEWEEKSTNVLSYLIAIFIFVFIMPFNLIIFSSIKLALKIRHLPKFTAKYGSFRSKNSDKFEKHNSNMRRVMLEKRVTMSAVFLIGSFLFTWLPYGLISFYSAFFDSSNLDPFLTTLPASFAKSSMFWSPAFLLIANKNLRRNLIEKYALFQIIFRHV